MSGYSGVGRAVGVAGDALAINNGLRQGGVAGYAGAALGAAKIANMGGADIPYLGPASDVLGIYNGVKQGGVAGYGGAAVDAAQLYAAGSAADVAAGGAGFAGAGAAASVGEIAGPIMAMYALYQIDQKSSQISPESQATMNWDSAKNYRDRAQTAAEQGFTQEAQDDQEMAGIMQLLGDRTIHMSAGALNSNFDTMGLVHGQADAAREFATGNNRINKS